MSLPLISSFYFCFLPSLSRSCYARLLPATCFVGPVYFSFTVAPSIRRSVGSIVECAANWVFHVCLPDCRLSVTASVYLAVLHVRKLPFNDTELSSRRSHVFLLTCAPSLSRWSLVFQAHLRIHVSVLGRSFERLDAFLSLYAFCFYTFIVFEFLISIFISRIGLARNEYKRFYCWEAVNEWREFFFFFLSEM